MLVVTRYRVYRFVPVSDVIKSENIVQINNYTALYAAQCIVIAPVCLCVCLWVRHTASAQCLRRL